MASVIVVSGALGRSPAQTAALAALRHRPTIIRVIAGATGTRGTGATWRRNIGGGERRRLEFGDRVRLSISPSAERGFRGPDRRFDGHDGHDGQQ